MEDIFFETSPANEHKLTETLDQASINAMRDDILTALQRVEKKWKRKMKKKNKKLEKQMKAISNQQLRQNAENYTETSKRFDKVPMVSTTERRGWMKMIRESVPKVLDIISIFLKRFFVPTYRTLPPTDRYRDGNYRRH